MAMNDELTPEAVAARSHNMPKVDKIAFEVKALYGLYRQSIYMPLNEDESIESGQICLTIDPEADRSSNIGVIDFATGSLKVRYGVQIVFPSLFRLVTDEKFDPSLLDPVRVTATDDCTLAKDRRGWQALGCLEFLPGSPWAGTGGG